MTADIQSPRAGDGILTGWKLVPVEPTMEMVNAFHTVSDSSALQRGYGRARWDDMLAVAPQPSAKLEDFCGVMQEVREAETAHGTKHRIAKWTCPNCGKACSTLELDGEWCHGDGLCISFINGKRIVRCTSCWLAAAPAAALAVEAEKLLPHAYLLAKVGMVMPLFQEARDALTAITEAQRRVHGISPTLADRMDVAGTFSLDDWKAGFQAPATGDAV